VTEAVSWQRPSINYHQQPLAFLPECFDLCSFKYTYIYVIFVLFAFLYIFSFLVLAQCQRNRLTGLIPSFIDTPPAAEFPTLSIIFHFLLRCVEAGPSGAVCKDNALLSNCQEGGYRICWDGNQVGGMPMRRGFGTAVWTLSAFHLPQPLPFRRNPWTNNFHARTPLPNHSLLSPADPHFRSTFTCV